MEKNLPEKSFFSHAFPKNSQQKNPIDALGGKVSVCAKEGGRKTGYKLFISLFLTPKNRYRLVDNTTCEDINECENLGACSQNCYNERGGFKCECIEGYMRDPRDHTRCKATEGHASLLFARRKDIRKISLDHREMTSIVNDTKSATALDYVFRTGMIFWSDVAEQKIYK